MLPIVTLGGACLYSSNKVAKLDREIKPLKEELRKVETNIAEVKEKCSKKLGEYSKRNKVDWRMLSTLTPEIERAIMALSQGDFVTASDEFENTGHKLRDITS